MYKILKKSRYLFFIESSDENFILYHSATGMILSCYEKEYVEKAKSIENSDEIKFDPNNDLICLLYDKGALLDYDFDEDTRIREMYEENIINQKQLRLTLIVTRQCNFRCAYCGQKHQSKRMSENTYNSILKFIKKMCNDHGFKSVSISFFGGEPLLEYKNIIEFLKQLKAFAEENAINYTAGMTTNAYLLDSKKFTELATLGCSDYQITLDGMDYTHDTKRYRIGKKPTWKTIVENLKYMKSTDIRFSMLLRTNFDFTVLNSIEEYLDFVASTLKDERILIYYETIKNHGNVNQSEYIGNIEAVFSNVEISKMLRDRGLKSSIVYYSTQPGYLICGAGLPNFYVIDFDGSIKKCTHRLNSEINKIGELHDDGTVTINKNLHSRWVYRDYLSNSKCQSCKLLPLCFGKKCPVCQVEDKLEFICDPELEKIELEEIIRAHI